MRVWKMSIELGPLKWNLGRNVGGVTIEHGGVTIEHGGGHSAAFEGE